MGKIAWGITGGGHLLKESVEVIRDTGDTDLFVSPAGMEVLRMYSIDLPVKPVTDKSASTRASRSFSMGIYDLFVIAPATSNSVAKFVCGISDTMMTTLFAQCGKSRVPIIVLPTDTEETMYSMGVTKPVKVYPRPVDLENIEKLGRFPQVDIVKTIEELKTAIRRSPGLKGRANG